MAKKEFSSGGVIIRKEPDGIKVLLIKDRFGRWTWPKGHIEAGETPQKAAAREIEEETGVKDLKLVAPVDNVQYSFKSGNCTIFKTVQLYLFEAGPEEKIRVLVSEIADAKWFDSEDALKKVEYKGSRELLKKALDAFLSKQPKASP